jgi:conjugal transfer pilus assembly protein TraW
MRALYAARELPLWTDPKLPVFGRRSRCRTLGLALMFSTALGAGSASAEYLGNYGNLWSIEEEHAVTQTIEKLKELERTGELQKRMDRYRRETLDAIENPEPIPGIQTVSFPKTYLLDPSVTVQDNMVDDTGKVLALAGTRINPLEYTKWTKSVLLIDARDDRQVALALDRLEKFPKDKVILVGGSYTKFMREHKRQVYFDLGGVFTTRFDIKYVPALVSQEGMALKVQEIAFSAESGTPVVMPLADGIQPVKSDKVPE